MVQVKFDDFFHLEGKISRYCVGDISNIIAVTVSIYKESNIFFNFEVIINQTSSTIRVPTECFVPQM